MTRPGTEGSLQLLSVPRVGLVAEPVLPASVPDCLGCVPRSRQFSDGAGRSAGRWIVRGASRWGVAGLCGCETASPPADGVREIASEDGLLWTAGVRGAAPASDSLPLVTAGVRPTEPSPERSLEITRPASRGVSAVAEGVDPPPRVTAPPGV
jgi:hypothetical protein